METRVESLPPDVIQCEAGWQLEKKVDVMLSGCVVGNKDRKGQEGVCQFVMFLKWSCNIGKHLCTIFS